MLKHLPNALTLLRLVLAPVVAWAIWQDYADPDGAWAIIAAALFIVAALTDLFDGMAARAFNAHSKFGRVIDPIADKALVGLPLIMIAISIFNEESGLAAASWMVTGLVVIAVATAVIVSRDVLITLMRLASPDREGVKVSQLAKWKTAFELIAVGLWIFLMALREPPLVSPFGGTILALFGPALIVAWFGLLVIAAALSAITGLQYLTAKPAQPSEAKPEM